MVRQHEERIRNGMKAYELLEQLRAGSTDHAVRDQFTIKHEERSGYGLPLKRYTPTCPDATEAQIQQATKDSIPRVAPLRSLSGVSYGGVRLPAAGDIALFLLERDS